MSTGTDEFGTPYDQTEFPMSEGKMETNAEQLYREYTKETLGVSKEAVGSFPAKILLHFGNWLLAYASRAAAGTTTKKPRMMSKPGGHPSYNPHPWCPECVGVCDEVATVAPVEAKPDVCPQCGFADNNILIHGAGICQHPWHPLHPSKPDRCPTCESTIKAGYLAGCMHKNVAPDPWHSLRPSQPPAEPTEKCDMCGGAVIGSIHYILPSGARRRTSCFKKMGWNDIEEQKSQAAPRPVERTPTDYAIEHGGYLADAVEHYLEERNKFDMLDTVDVGDQDSLNDHIRALRDCVYEFRKRRGALSSSSSATPQFLDLVREVGGDEATAKAMLHRLIAEGVLTLNQDWSVSSSVSAPASDSPETGEGKK